MPVIRITQQTWERLKRHATPLVHTANDIVEMALEALDARVKKAGQLFMHVSLPPHQRESTID
jgi:hypothetical protein